MRTVTIQNENGDSYSFSGESMHPEHELLENEIRQLACIIQEARNSLENSLYIVERCVEDPPGSAREVVHRKQMIEDSIKVSAVELCSALDRKIKPHTYKGKVFIEFCKNPKMEEAWDHVRKWRNKSIAHKIHSIHNFKGYNQGSLISAYTNQKYVSGLDEDLLNCLNTIIPELMQCVVTVYLRSREELELQELQGFRGTDTTTDESLWNDLSLGRNMNTKIDQAQKSIEIDARKLIEALKSGKGIISVWETTCQDMLNPVRKAWIELCSKIRHDPEKCKTCNDFVRLVHQFEELPPTQQEVETGIMNGFGGPYGDDNRLDLIAITEKLFPP